MSFVIGLIIIVGVECTLILGSLEDDRMEKDLKGSKHVHRK